ncbi:hypothetical protein T492DRAFT_889691, partial [Pavlovales sp. CCMP2436]
MRFSRRRVVAVVRAGAAVAAVTLLYALLAWLATPPDFPRLVSRPHVPVSAHACCSPPPKRTGAAGGFARIAIVTDVGCWPQPSESAHAQLELIELLASLGAAPTVLSLLLACDDLGLLRPPASGVLSGEQTERLRSRLTAFEGASVHWLRLGESSNAPAGLQLSLAVARHIEAHGSQFDRVVFPDSRGLALLAALAPVSHLRISVLALGPLLWRRQWCLQPLNEVAELDDIDREAQ